MKIDSINPLEMTRTNPAHYGNTKIVPLTRSDGFGMPVDPVDSVNRDVPGASVIRLDPSSITENSARVTQEKNRATFKDYLLNAMGAMNSQQNDVSSIEEKLITDPDSVDIQDVTIAMAKARSSLNLAQTVISHLVKGWSEITTTR